MAMGAYYSFELISIETYAPQFIGHNKLFLGSVYFESMLSSNSIFFQATNAYTSFSFERKVSLKVEFLYFAAKKHVHITFHNMTLLQNRYKINLFFILFRQN